MIKKQIPFPYSIYINNLFKGYLLFIFLFGIPFLFAQKNLPFHPYFFSLTVAEGLRSSVVYDLHLDKKGRLFIATEKGLFMYNGISFREIPVRKPAYASPITGLLEDVKGRIWCRDFVRNIFYFQNDSLSVLSLEQILPDLKPDESILELLSFQGKLAIQTNIGLYIYNPYSTSKYSKLLTQSEKSTFFSLNKGNKNALIGCTQDGFIVEIEENNKQKIICRNPLIHNLSATVAKGEIYLISQYHYSGQVFTIVNGNLTITFPEIKKADLLLYSLKNTADQKLWLCTNQGVYLLHPETNSWEGPYLSGERISDIECDNTGNYWISSLDNGVFCIPDFNFNQVFFPFVDGKKNIIQRIIPGKKGGIFAGNNKGGIIEISEEGAIVRTISNTLNTDIEFLFFDSIQNKIWATNGIYDLSLNKTLRSDYFGKKVIPLQNGNYLKASGSGISIIRLDNKIDLLPFSIIDTSKITLTPYLSYSLGKIRARVAAYDSLNNIFYAGYNHKLIAYSPQLFSGKIMEKTINSTLGEPIFATDMITTPDGRTWVSTLHQGVFCLKGTQLIAQLDTSKKISSMACRKLFLKDSFVWVITDEGLDCININTSEVSNIQIPGSVANSSILDACINGNKIWLATNTGIICFSTHKVSNNRAPEIYPTKFISRNVIVDLNLYPDSIPFLDLQSFPAKLMFEEVATYPSKKFFIHHRLLPDDTTWSKQSPGLGGININPSGPGEYILLIQAIDGNRLGKVHLFRFKVSKPFWLDTWFLILWILLLLLLAFCIYLFAVHRLKNKQKVLEQIAQSQMIALRAQMNPHFLYNVLVSIQSFIFTNQKQDANVYLGKFADLMRKILSMSEKQEISLQEEIEALELYLELENIRFEGKLNCNIKIDPLLSPEMISIPSMILQPYVENAIKHGLLHRRGDKELNISFKALNDGKQMSIEIEDNGIGRKASEGINRKRRNKPGSFASNAILSRLQILNSIRKDKIQSQILDKYNSEGVSDGTLVRIILPIQIFK